MVRRAFRVLPVVAVLLLASGEALAAGYGLYGSYGQGTATATRNRAGGGETEFDQTSTHMGMGLVYDSNVLEDRSFNWRGAVGYEKMDLEADGGSGTFTDGYESDYKGRLVLENDFGLGAKAGSRMRLWGGATTRLAFFTGQDESHGGPRDQKVFSAGVGPVVGVNVGITEKWAVSLKGGYLLSGYMGRWSDGSAGRQDMSATGGNWFLNLSVLVKGDEISWTGKDDTAASGGDF